MSAPLTRQEAERRQKRRAEGKPLHDTVPVAKVAIPSTTHGMNKTEAKRAMELEAMKKTGLIHDWKFEAVTVKIGHDCRLTLDFLIVENDGSLCFEDTKGTFTREDATIKMRAFRTIFPYFPLRVLKLKGGTWDITEMK